MSDAWGGSFGVAWGASFGQQAPIVILDDSHDPGIEKRRRKLIDDERDRRERRKQQVIAAFERTIEGKPQITEAEAEVIVEAIEINNPEKTFDFEKILRDMSKIEALWDEYIENDDMEVISLL